MIAAFWIVVSVLLVGTLLFVLPPLLRRTAPAAGVSRDATNVAVYRDQLRELEEDVASGVLSRESYEDAKREIERRLLQDVGDTAHAAAAAGHSGRNAAIAIAVALPLVAFALYLSVGNLQALLPGVADTASQGAHGVEAQQIQAMVDRLAERMKREPDNVEGWVMLGRSYSALGKFDEAARAFSNAVARAGTDAGLLADYADALAMAHGRTLEGEPEKIVQRALALDPRNVKALALAGTAAFEQHDYAGAVEYWERILQVAPPDSEFARSVQSSIAEARQLGGKPGAASPVARAPVAVTGGNAQAVGGGTVSGVVEIAPALAARVAPTDTLFVFARAAEGPRMPLAIVRAQAKDLPLKFRLDDSMAMASGMNLSSQKRVIVGARISKAGSATPQAGDLEGLSSPVDVGASSVAVLIDAETK